MIEAPEEIDRPVEEGERLGKVAVTVGGRPAGSVPLVAERAVEGATLVQKATSTLFNPLVLVPLGLVVIGAGLLIARRGQRPKPPKGPRAPRVKAPKKPRRKPKNGATTGTGGPRSKEERERMREERMRRRNAKQPDRIEEPGK